MTVSYRPIDEFPTYSVGDDGTVWNDSTRREVTQAVNQAGVSHVALGIGSSQQRRRSVGVLVARAFLPPPPAEHFDTIINLDGNRQNNAAYNLAWRPRWFAIKYHQQFNNDQRGYIIPIYCLDTRETFPNSWEAAIKYGLIDRDIYICTSNRTPVFPTWQRFEVVT